jgi:CheY-like chemotaxis protein
MEIGTVMLVDDEADIRTISELALREVGGWRVMVAESGTQALELAAAETPDVVLLDVMMPRLDGPSTLKRLREDLGLEAPVIFVTSRARPSDVESYLSLGAIGVIPKPFDPMALPGEIRRIVDESRA